MTEKYEEETKENVVLLSATLLNRIIVKWISFLLSYYLSIFSSTKLNYSSTIAVAVLVAHPYSTTAGSITHTDPL